MTERKERKKERSDELKKWQQKTLVERLFDERELRKIALDEDPLGFSAVQST